MNELFNRIGLLGIHPDAAFYLDNIPGISVELAAKVNKTTAFETFYAGIIATASEKFRSSMQGHLSKCGFNYALVQSPAASLSLQELQIESGSRAVCLITGDNYGKYAALEIKDVSFCAKFPTTATVKVYDNNGFTPLEIASEEITVTAGANNVVFEPVVSVQNHSANVNVSIVLEFNIAQTLRTFNVFSAEDLDLILSSYVESDSVLNDSLDTMSVTAEVVFDLGKVAAEYKKELTYAAACLVSAMILDEKAGSYKLNTFTQKNTADSVSRAESLMMEFEKSLKDYAPTIASKIQKSAVSPIAYERPSYTIGSLNA